MICHQKLVRDKEAETATDGELFGAWWESLDKSREKAVVREIKFEVAKAVIARYEWLGTMPSGMICAYGLYLDGGLCAVECFTDSKAGSMYSLKTRPAICLARGACVHWAPPWAASYLIRESLRRLDGEKYHFALAYSDTDAGEIGTVYQAVGWFCLGRVVNEFWRSPDGRRLDRNHHRDRAKLRTEDGTMRVVGNDHEIEREKMLAAGWQYMTGGVRYQYAFPLGRGRAYRERREFLKCLSVAYPKRAGGFNKGNAAESTVESEGRFLDGAPKSNGGDDDER